MRNCTMSLIAISRLLGVALMLFPCSSLDEKSSGIGSSLVMLYMYDKSSEFYQEDIGSIWLYR